MDRTQVVIMGAAGRDFHDFNVVYRDDASVEVVAFTATQIPGIDRRRYPPELAGPLYPDGIEIVPETELEKIFARQRIDRVVFAYSDVAHDFVMHQASRALAGGANFVLLGPVCTMIKSTRPVVATGATRTGAGKSQTTRCLAGLLEAQGLKVVVIRHPMPYGDLVKQRVQRFATHADLDRHQTTIEEREEYEPHLEAGSVVWAGVDYAEILSRAVAEADVIVWDGGNNDLPFFAPTVHLCLVDPLRPGHESRYHPGEANLRMAHVAVIVKEDTAGPEAVERARAAIRELNPAARIVDARMPIRIEDPEAVRGRRVLAVEDGPTLTHGGMSLGAAALAARALGATLVDPRPWARGSIAEVFTRYPALGPVLPAMGYDTAQRADLEATINAVPCDTVLLGTPMDLRRGLTLRHPVTRARYEMEEAGPLSLDEVLEGL